MASPPHTTPRWFIATSSRTTSSMHDLLAAIAPVPSEPIRGVAQVIVSGLEATRPARNRRPA
jgi:hypothetical protein